MEIAIKPLFFSGNHGTSPPSLPAGRQAVPLPMKTASQLAGMVKNVVLNLFQHLMEPISYETLKRVQGDKKRMIYDTVASVRGLGNMYLLFPLRRFGGRPKLCGANQAGAAVKSDVYRQVEERPDAGLCHNSLPYAPP